MAEAHRLLETGETEGATVLLPGRGTFGSARKAIARLPGGRYASSRRSRMDNDHSTRGFARLPRGVRAAARNLGWLLASRGVLAVLSLVYLGVATRTLGAADFGRFALITGASQAIPPDRKSPRPNSSH